MFVESKSSSFYVNTFAGGIIALWKSVLITVKEEIGGASAQIELRGVADKRMLYHLHYPRTDDIERPLNESVVDKYVTTVLIIITFPRTLFLA